MKITTSIIINASSQKVWAILTNFQAYPKWNPFVKYIAGDQEVGSKLEIHLDGMIFKPLIKQYNHEKELSWLGYLWVKGLFDGYHSLKINKIGNEQCEFIHEEEFKGILVPLLKHKLQTETQLGFIQMNKALKNRAERAV